MSMDVTLRDTGLAEWNQALTALLDISEQQWWLQARNRLGQTADVNGAAMLSSQCKRHLRRQAVPGVEGRDSIELARALLLAQVSEAHPAHARPALLQQLFLWGDDEEKIALLKALDWLDSQGACVDLALLAGRTSNPRVFAALALDNPYPSRHYPERAFQQLLLKALGMGLDAGRVIGIEQRRGAELNQLALDLMDEQLAANRAVPASLPRLIAFQLLEPAQCQRLADLHRQGRLPAEWQAHCAGP